MLGSRKRAVQQPSYVLRNETYGELTRGARVKITGESGSWRFLCHCVNTDTGSEWLDVFGGPNGSETLRAFRAERVHLIPPKGRRVRKPPTLEELI